jgi:hypothetical protein
MNKDVLTREAILGVDDLQVEVVDVPEWGGAVRVRGLTGAERDAFESSIIDQRGKKSRIILRNIRAKLVVLSVVDGENKSLFNEGDVKALGSKSASALQRVFNVAQRLSGISDEDVEELAGNLGDGQSDGFISG